MDQKQRVPIKVNIQPSEYSGRSIRLGDPQSDIRDKMNQRMRDFEEESKRWREQFLSNSGLGATSTTGLLTDHRPRMLVNFPEFPELTPPSWSTSSIQPLGRNGSGSGLFQQSNAQKSFIEEDNEGNKRYKLQVEIGDFKPNEIQVRTEGRLLIIKGDRELVAGSATESKQFNREITIPDFVEPTSVVSYLADGVLSIEAPVIVERLSLTGGGGGATSSSSHSTSTISSSSGNTLTSNTAARRSPFRDNKSPSRTLINVDSGRNQAQTLSSSNNLGHNTFHHDSIINANNQASSTSSIGQITNSVANYKFNMSEFRPEDISITVTETTLKVHAIREENEPRGVGKTYREFKREIGLPQGADVKRLKNSLLPDGTLHIEIPVQDNSSLKPQFSPSGFNKQFSNLSISNNNNNNNNSNTSTILLDTANRLQSSSPSDVNERVNIGDKELKITFDLTGYKPEDVNIKVTDNTLKVHAIHIDNSRGNQIHREYSRSYILPEWVNPELLRARMSDNGTLTVEVPLPQVQPSKLERVIKIQQ